MLRIVGRLFQRKNKPIKTPVVLQMDAVECGAAALAIILGYYGCYVSLEALRVQCGISRDGSRADFILQAAREYGLNAQAANLTSADIDALAFPCIAHWRFNHFVVLEGHNEQGVYINDPAFGRRLITPAEFQQSFTGVALLFTLGSTFARQGQPLSLLPYFHKRFENSKDALRFLLLVSFALVLPGILAPGFSKIFIDDILINQWHDWLRPLLLGMVLTAAIRAALTWLQQYYLLRLRLKFLVTSSLALLNHLFALPLSFFQQRFAGDIIERMAGNERITQLFSNELAASLFGVFATITYALIMLLLSPLLTLLSLLSVALQAKIWLVFAASLGEQQQRLVQQRGKLSGIEMNALHMLPLLKATSAEQSFFQRWSSFHGAFINNQQCLLVQQKWLMVLQQSMNALTALLILTLGIWQVIRGHLTVGTLVAFQSLLASFQAPVQTWLNLAVNMQKIRGDITRQQDVLHHPVDPRLALPRVNTNNADDNITLSHVTFGYSPRRKPLLQDLSFNIAAGSCVAFIGRSGAGKSTLIKLLLGLLPPWSGQITWGGIALADINSAQLAEKMAYVDQEIQLFSGSVRENLTLWRNDIKDHKLYAALEAVELLDLIEQRGGLDASIAENGENFSGGQQQRLEIARALACSPSVLLLDEATANLDQLLEQRILQKIQDLKITTIIISHRLSAIRDCQQIFVFDQGQIVQQGTHAELLTQAGLYTSLLQEENPSA